MEDTFGKFYQYTAQADEMVAQGIVDTYTAAYKEMLKANADLANDVYFRAAKAAQEAKTFQEAIVATKDAVSSGWMSTFDMIFGDYDQARKTWSALAEDLYTIFAEPGNRRNDTLAKAFKGGFDQLKSAFTEFGIFTDSYQDDFAKFLDSNGFKVEDLITKYGSLSAAIAAGANVDRWYGASDSVNNLFTKFTNQFLLNLDKSTNAVMNSTDALSKVQGMFDSIWSGEFGNGAERVKKLAEAEIDYATAQGLINDLAEKGHRGGYKLVAEDIANLTEEQRKALGITEEFSEQQQELAKAMAILKEEGIEPLSEEFMELDDEWLRSKGISEEVTASLRQMFKTINRKSGQVLISETISNITGSIINLQEAIRNAWAEIFQYDMSEILYRIVEKVHDFTEGIYNLTDAIKNGNADFSIFRVVLEGIIGVGKILSSVFGLLKEVVFQLIQGGIKVLSALFGDLNIDVGELSTTFSDAIDKATEWLKENQTITEAVEKAAASVGKIIGYVEDWLNKIGALPQLKTFVSGMSKNIETLVKDGISLDTVTNLYTDTVDKIKKGDFNPFAGVGATLMDWFTNFGAKAEDFKNNTVKNLSEAFAKIAPSQETLQKWSDAFKQFTDTLIAVGAGYLALTTFKKLAETMSAIVSPIRAFSDVMASFASAGYALRDYFVQLKHNQVVNNILKIAVAVGILAASMYALALVGKTDALWTAIKATGALLGLITVFAYLLSLISKQMAGNEKTVISFKNFALLIASFGAAMLLFAVSMKMLDGIKMETWIGAALALPVLIAVIVQAVRAIAKAEGGINKSALLSIVALALGIRLMVGAIKDLDKLDIQHPIRTIAYFLALVGTVVGALWILKGVGSGAAAPLLAFAATIYAMVAVIQKISKIKDEDYVRGLLGLIPVLGALLAVTLIINKVKLAKSKALFVVSVAGSVYLLAKAIEQLGKLDPGTLTKGGIAATLLFTAVGALGALIGRLADLKNGTIKSAIGVSIIMVTAAASIYVMVGAILLFKNIPTADLFKAVGAIAA